MSDKLLQKNYTKIIELKKKEVGDKKINGKKNIIKKNIEKKVKNTTTTINKNLTNKNNSDTKKKEPIKKNKADPKKKADTKKSTDKSGPKETPKTKSTKVPYIVRKIDAVSFVNEGTNPYPVVVGNSIHTKTQVYHPNIVKVLPAVNAQQLMNNIVKTNGPTPRPKPTYSYSRFHNTFVNHNIVRQSNGSAGVILTRTLNPNYVKNANAQLKLVVLLYIYIKYISHICLLYVQCTYSKHICVMSLLMMMMMMMIYIYILPLIIVRIIFSNM